MKKTAIQRKEIKCEWEINCKGWSDFLKGSTQNSRVGREKKETKKGHRCQTRCDLGARPISLRLGRRDLSNTTPEGVFLIIFNKFNVQQYLSVPLEFTIKPM
jgi:hypothetical protein